MRDSLFDSQLHPWCHPDCHYLPSLPHCQEAMVTTFPGCSTAWEPPTCSYLPMLRGSHPCIPTSNRLSSASRSRRRSEEAHPFRTSTLLRIAVGRPSHTIFVHRGSVYINLPDVSITCTDKQCQCKQNPNCVIAILAYIDVSLDFRAHPLIRYNSKSVTG
jgi:hypothetical protein